MYSSKNDNNSKVAREEHHPQKQEDDGGINEKESLMGKQIFLKSAMALYVNKIHFDKNLGPRQIEP